ncbi:TRAP transporter small permease [Sinobaca sp. H24]|uniref:TRAP transporter small permease n=1 Tax=Sinobaca sp. H24 TaxID=2923376 RepID=UPI00207AEAAB|nr:TRAP transporter small permease [Sinobaca sp. H24]
MRKLINNIDRVQTWIEENLLFLLLVLMLGANFFSLLNRYIFQEGIAWGEELPRYLLIWATFIGGSYGIKKGIHITVDILIIYLSEKKKKYVRAISYSISILFCLSLLWVGLPYIINIAATNQLSPGMQLPMYWLYLSVVVGSFMMMSRLIILFVRDVIYKEEIESEDAMKID